MNKDKKNNNPGLFIYVEPFHISNYLNKEYRIANIGNEYTSRNCTVPASYHIHIGGTHKHNSRIHNRKNDDK